MLLCEQRGEGDEARAHHARHDGGVQFVFQKALFHLIGGVHRHLQADVREAGAEICRQGGHAVHAEGDAGAHAQQAVGIRVLKRGLHLVVQADEVRGIAQQGAARLGYFQALADALEQAGAVVLLQLADGDADGGLGHIQCLRGPGDAFRVCHGDEDAEVTDGQRPCLPFKTVYPRRNGGAPEEL